MSTPSLSVVAPANAPSTPLVLAMAAGAGFSVASLYYSQPMLGLIAQDADALDCQPHVARLRDMVAHGTAAEAQRAIDALTGLPRNSYTQGLLQLAAQLLERRA